MIKRTFAIITTIILLCITSVPFYTCFSYADVGDSLGDQQIAELSAAAYYNVRSSYLSGTNKSTVVGVLKSQIDSFFDSESNTTGITSYSDLRNHIVITTNNGHYGIQMDRQAVQYFDNLIKYLLGKGEFPELYDGAWTDAVSTNDLLYNGFTASGTNFYICDLSDSSNGVTAPLTDPHLISQNSGGVAYQVDSDKMRTGTIVGGLSSRLTLGNYCSTYNVTTANFFDQSLTNAALNIDDDTTGVKLTSETVNYFSNLSYTFNFGRDRTTSSANLYRSPCLRFRNFSVSVTNKSSVSSSTNNPTSNTSYATRDDYICGNPALIVVKYKSGINRMYCGWVILNHTKNVATFTLMEIITAEGQPSIQEGSANFNTKDFDKNDLEDSMSQDQQTIDLVPKHTDPGQNNNSSNPTYNYYNSTNTTVNNFYNDYINNFYNNETIIEKPSDSGQGGNSTPGGNDPGWGNGSNNSGTITPDPNNPGSYNFTLPDFNLPDLNIDWNISGLHEKFPFSIPWDLMAFFTVLNADPETPRLQGNINLGLTVWAIDWDLHAFDTVAAILRNLEFIGFCIGLILITRQIIKG